MPALDRITHCPFCKVELTGSGIQHVRTECPNKPADFEERIKKAGTQIAGAFDILRARGRHKKRRETLEEYKARIMWFGKRDGPALPTDFDYVSDETVNKVMDGMRKIREEREAKKDSAP